MRYAASRLVWIFVLALLSAAIVAGPAPAQDAVEVEAICGEPFGVGRLAIQLPEQALPEVLGAQGLGLSEKDGRVLYPVVKGSANTAAVMDLLMQSPLMSGGPIRQQAGGLLRELLSRPPKTTVYFLFRGEGPLRVRLLARQAYELTVEPRHHTPTHRRLLKAWWREYAAEPGGLFRKTRDDYPPLVDNFLKAMLARRIGLTLPERSKLKPAHKQLQEQLGLFLGTEEVRVAMIRDRVLGRVEFTQEATLKTTVPLPEPDDVPELQLPEPAADVKVEPIALRVPAECLYVRFGSFSNFLWIQDTLEKWGGDLRNLVALRGLDHEMRRRMEQQLVVKQTALSRMLGNTVISDVAIIGTDMFMREGAAYGLLFEARNSLLLESDFARNRANRLKEDKTVTEQTVTIAGKKVSLLSSPGGAVRSFYVADKGYLLVSSSKTLMRRFLETGEGKGALGRSKEFRHARTVMPVDRNDTVFVYLSDTFFRNMAGPRYWIEIRRRLQAVADLEAVQLAMLASAAEGKPGETIDELLSGGFLPPGFGSRADGSRTTIQDDEVLDSLRGRRGSFLPVPDVPLEKITPDEAEAYRGFVDFYDSKWGRLDPMLIGIKREGLSGNRERVVVDAQANPLARRHFDALARFVGPAQKQRLAPIPGDLVAGEMAMKDQVVFGGLRDFGLPFEIVDGRLLPAGGIFNALVGYLGTTGELGLLSLLDLMITSPPDAAGYARGRGPMWRHHNERFTVFSLHREVLATVCGQLRFEPADRPAQFRLRVDDLSSARLTPMLNALAYLRTRQTTLGNIRLMHSLEQQLHVPGTDCKMAAELLLDCKLICPLGGQYAYRDSPQAVGYWTSTALGDGGSQSFLNVRVPEGMQAPPLSWFRGLTMDATMTDKTLSAHVEIVMQLPEPKKKKPAPEEVKDESKEKKPDKKSSWWESILPSGKK